VGHAKPRTPLDCGRRVGGWLSAASHMRVSKFGICTCIGICSVVQLDRDCSAPRQVLSIASMFTRHHLATAAYRLLRFPYGRTEHASCARSPGSCARLSLADSLSAQERLHSLVGYLRGQHPAGVYLHAKSSQTINSYMQSIYLVAGWPALPHRVFSSPPAHCFSV
jgi:hypothetical protein